MHGVGNVALVQRAAPSDPDPDDVQISIRSVGLCGSDLKYFTEGGVSSDIQRPFILGHESSGEVVKVGDNVRHLQVGQRVAIEPGKPCWKCDYCHRGNYNLCLEMYFMASRSRDGALQEVLNWPAALAYALPDLISNDEGALIEPMSVALSGVQMGEIRLGERVLVLGAGAIGLLVAQFAKIAGAGFVAVTDTQSQRLEIAKSLGADRVIDVTTLASNDDGKPAQLTLNPDSIDVLIDTTGAAAAIGQAYAVLKRGGRITMIGLGHQVMPLSLLDIVYKQLTIQGVYRYKNTYPTVIQALIKKQIAVQPLITHHFEIDQVTVAFQTALKMDQAIKVMILFP